MRKQDLMRHKAVLNARIAELSRTLLARPEIVIESTAEEYERSEQAAQRELAVMTLDRSSWFLREAKEALARIEDGSYGICESCGEPIAPKRLDAVPWARYCLQCQDQMDRGPGGSDPRLQAAA